MSVEEIKSVIAQLPACEVADLASWLVEYHHSLWDKQIEADLAAGRLDSVFAEAEREYHAGLARPLDCGT